MRQSGREEGGLRLEQRREESDGPRTRHRCDDAWRAASLTSRANARGFHVSWIHDLKSRGIPPRREENQESLVKPLWIV